MGERKYSLLEILAVIVAVIVAGIFVTAVAVDYITKRADCDRRHGVLARTAFGFDCVAAPASRPTSPGAEP